MHNIINTCWNCGNEYEVFKEGTPTVCNGCLMRVDEIEIVDDYNWEPAFSPKIHEKLTRRGNGI